MIQQENSATPGPPPIANSYWVEPGRLLAGEYPGSASQAETLDRIQRLLRAGVNTFIDLTDAGELAPYASFLPADGPVPVEHHRWPIVDHALPQSPSYLAQILDAIEAALASGRCVYVHCRAGIGRTGTTIGCYLTRTGLTPYEALEQLQDLWQQSARSRTWPSVPETEEQYAFVRDWSEPMRGRRADTLSLADRCEGALVGLAIGDAVSTLIASGKVDREQLVQGLLPAGMTLIPGADTAMTLAVAESLLSAGRHDPQDQMQRYLAALRAAPDAAWAADFKRALAAWQWSRKPNVGTHDPKNQDPHSLARGLAAALYLHNDAAAAAALAADISRTTQQSPVVLDLCRLWTALLIDTLAGSPLMEGSAVKAVRERRLRPELDDLINARWSVLARQSDGALSICARTLLALQAGPTFAAGLSQALQEPRAATAGALYGSLAGAQFGVDGIPQRWRQALPQLVELRALAQRFGS